jgi:hypothetical protein
VWTSFLRGKIKKDERTYTASVGFKENIMNLTGEQVDKFIEFMYSYYSYECVDWSADIHEFLESVFGEVEF